MKTFVTVWIEIGGTLSAEELSEVRRLALLDNERSLEFLPGDHPETSVLSYIDCGSKSGSYGRLRAYLEQRGIPYDEVRKTLEEDACSLTRYRPGKGAHEFAADPQSLVPVVRGEAILRALRECLSYETLQSELRRLVGLDIPALSPLEGVYTA